MKSIWIEILSIPKFIPRYEEFNIKSMNVADNIPVANGAGHAVYHLYVVVLEESVSRKKLMDYLKKF